MVIDARRRQLFIATHSFVCDISVAEIPNSMRIIIWILSAAAVLAGSFFGALCFFDQFFPLLGYDVASFPRVVQGQTLRFRNNENRGALISGWSIPETWGVWSDGYEAKLGFVVLGIRSENAKIFLECVTLSAEKIPERTMEIWSRNIKLGDVTMKEPANKSFSVPLSGLKLGEEYPLVLRLKMPFARSPKELNIGSDSRRLGVGLLNVRFDN